MLNGPRKTVQRARQLRRSLSLPEGLLWRALRERPAGFKYRRQQPAGDYVLDFFCAEAKLAIEVDGSAHDCSGRRERDSARDMWLAMHGVETLRVPAADVLRDLDAVVARILTTAAGRRPLHRPTGGPPPRSGEEFG